MTDEGRFNIMPEVADRLGYNLSDNASLWRDAALNVVNEVGPHAMQPLIVCGI